MFFFRFMLPEPPPATVPLADFDLYRWRLHAACPACKGYRAIDARARGRTPVLDLFYAGKLTCRLHRRPANRVKIGRWINALMGEETVGEWALS